MAEKARGERVLAPDEAPAPPTRACSDSMEKEFGRRLGPGSAGKPDHLCHPAYAQLREGGLGKLQALQSPPLQGSQGSSSTQNSPD